MTCCPTCGQKLPETGIHFDDEAAILIYDGRFLDLTPTEYELLSALWHAPGRSRTKEQIMNVLYSLRIDREPELKIVDVLVCKIRKKMKGFPIAIQTVWGTGYRIVQKAEVGS